MSAQSTVLMSMTVAVGGNVASILTGADDIADMLPAIRVGVGGFALTIGLLVVSEFQPALASSVAILVMVASLLGPNGVALFDTVMKTINRPTTAAAAGSGGSGSTQR